MRLSSMADYAVVLMSAAARHCGKASLVDAGKKKGARTNAAALAEETGVPLATAQRLVSMLSKAGLVRSTRGTGGGIQLARPAAAITLTDIIEAVEGPIAMTACVENGRHDCGLEECCTVRPHWGPVNNAVRGALDGVSLASLSEGVSA